MEEKKKRKDDGDYIRLSQSKLDKDVAIVKGGFGGSCFEKSGENIKSFCFGELAVVLNSGFMLESPESS